MIRRLLTIAAASVDTSAYAAMPVFVATCPSDIHVDSGRTGVVYINGQKAKIKKYEENTYDFEAGHITVSVTDNPGRSPDVFYSGKGKAAGADLSQADGDMTFKATKEADLFKIRAGHERYAIPEAAVFGG